MKYLCMLSYDTAKKLKEVGYVQEGSGVGLFPNGKDTFRGPMIGVPNDVVYIPTLSELIEACGYTKFFVLMKNNGQWQAGNGNTPFQGNAVAGALPEEAVANLWLALNNKV